MSRYNKKTFAESALDYWLNAGNNHPSNVRNFRDSINDENVNKNIVVNYGGKSGVQTYYTPLHMALCKDDLEFAKYLVENHRINFSVKDSSGKTALETAKDIALLDKDIANNSEMEKHNLSENKTASFLMNFAKEKGLMKQKSLQDQQPSTSLIPRIWNRFKDLFRGKDEEKGSSRL